MRHPLRLSRKPPRATSTGHQRPCLSPCMSSSAAQLRGPAHAVCGASAAGIRLDYRCSTGRRKPNLIQAAGKQCVAQRGGSGLRFSCPSASGSAACKRRSLNTQHPPATGTWLMMSSQSTQSWHGQTSQPSRAGTVVCGGGGCRRCSMLTWHLSGAVSARRRGGRLAVSVHIDRRRRTSRLTAHTKCLHTTPPGCRWTLKSAPRPSWCSMSSPCRSAPRTPGWKSAHALSEKQQGAPTRPQPRGLAAQVPFWQ